MGTIGYYIALPFIYGISMLPFRLLYVLSDLMNFVLFGVIGYRKQVVMTNLRNSFPEKSETELQAIAKRFYSWFCDLTLETLKTLTISPEALKERVTLHGIEILKNYAQRDQSIIIVLGHFGNWELAGARYSHEPGLPQLYVIYHPLQNKHFDALILKMRTRHGTRLYSMREATKSMLRDRHLLTATAFIAGTGILAYLYESGNTSISRHGEFSQEAGISCSVHFDHSTATWALQHESGDFSGNTDQHSGR